MQRSFWLSGLFALVMGFIGALLALTLVLPTLVDAQATQLRAGRVTVVGPNGAGRIRLAADVRDVGATLQVLDDAGERRVGLFTGTAGGTQAADVGGVSLWRDQNTPGGFFGLGRGPDGSRPLEPALVLNDAEGRGRVVITVRENGTPEMLLLDANGNVTWRAQ